MIGCRSAFRLFRPLILLTVFLAAALSAAPSGPQTIERKLKVKVERASVRSEPDAEASVIAMLKRGAELTSYESSGAFYRVVLEAGRDTVSLIGFIAAEDVEVLGEKITAKVDFWAESAPTAKSGLEVFLLGGYAAFGGGDFASGIGGLYDELKAMITGLDYAISREYFHSLTGGMQLGAGIYWRFSPRLAAGVIGEYSLAQRFNEFGFQEGVHELGASCTPVLTTFALRPGLRCGILAGGPVELAVTAGPAVYFSSFKYNLGVSYNFVANQGTMSDYSYYLKAQRTFLGAYLAVDLDLRVNSRSAIVLQAAYRVAKPSGWSGSDKTSLWGFLSGDTVSENAGSLFSMTRGPFPVLAVAAESPGPGASDAVFDYSGLSLQAGIRIRF